MDDLQVPIPPRLDGDQLSSTDFTARDVKSRIIHQTVTYNWKFQFLAANQDAITAGTGLGIAARACAQIDATEAGIECMCAPESSFSMALGEARMFARQARSRRRTNR